MRTQRAAIPRLTVIYALALSVSAAGIMSCALSGFSFNSTAPATHTSQAQRAIALATKSAGDLQRTFTAEAVEVFETQGALEALLAEYAAQPISLADTFSENSHEWPVGEENSELVSLVLDFQDGKYLWEMTANEGFFYWTRPDMEALADFYLSAQVHQVSGPADGTGGLLIRQRDEVNYYLFRISQDQYYSFYRFTEGELLPLIDWTPHDSIRSHEPNVLAVIGRESLFSFFINGEWVDEFIDDGIDEGRFGLVAGLFNPGETATIEFDEFELRDPD